MTPVVSKATVSASKRIFACSRVMAVFFSFSSLAFPGLLAARILGGTAKQSCGFFENMQNVLNVSSIVVVTIGIIIAAYQIAFARKRIADVSTLLIGALLIGAAIQLARMLMDGGDGSCSAAMLLNSAQVWKS